MSIQPRRLIGSLLVLLILLTGPESRAQPKQIEFWWQGDLYTTRIAEQAVAAFEEAHPEVDIILRVYSNEAYKTAIQVAVASNQPPDVFFNWAGEDTGRLVRGGLIEDLTPYAARYGWDRTLSAAALDPFRFDGRLYGAPYVIDSKYFFYDRVLFEQERIPIPRTFDALLDTCRLIRNRGLVPIAPIAFGNNERWPASHYVTLLNARFVPAPVRAQDYRLEAPEAALFTHAGYTEALQVFVAMQGAGCFNEGVNAMNPEIARALFYTEQTAMVFCGTWCFTIMDENGFKGRYALFPFPQVDGAGEDDAVIAGPNGLLISSRAREKEMAAAFIDFFLSRYNQRRIAQESRRVPVRADALDGAQVPPMLSWATEHLAQATHSALWIDVKLDATVVDTYLNAIQEVLNRTQTPAEAIATVRRKAVDVKRRRNL